MKAYIAFNQADHKAPLFARYQGQVNDQPAHISLDLETGAVDADYSGEVGGNSCTADVFHNRTLHWAINNHLAGSQVMEILEELLPQMQAILDDSEVDWDQNSNLVGKLGESAQGIYESIDDNGSMPVGIDAECTVITDLAEWLASGGEDLWLPSESDDVADFIRDFDLDGYTALEHVGDVLTEMWADRLYNGDPLPKNVAQWLLDDGRCDDSAWTDELQAYAEGRDPEDDE